MFNNPQIHIYILVFTCLLHLILINTVKMVVGITCTEAY